MNIALYGFMGSGKTQLGKALALRMQYDFVDLDAEIERFAKKSIRQIFQDEGEIAFRKIEHNVLKDFIRKDTQDVILSLGGGSILQPTNRKLLDIRNYKKIYLNVHIDTLIARLRNERDNRPLLQNIKETEFDDYIKALFESRRSVYEKNADLTIDIYKEDFITVLDKLYMYLNLS